MNELFVVGGFLLGIFVGALIVWLILNGKFHAMNNNSSSGQLEGAKLLAQEQNARSLLEVTTAAKDSQIAEYKQQSSNLAAEIKLLNDKLNQEISRASAAETLTKRIPDLETKIKNEEDKADTLFTEVRNLSVQLQQSTTMLQEEKKSAAEKLSLLSDAQVKLSDSFKALSADALKNNTDLFMQTAKFHFSKLQEGAAQELELRKQSIDNLVKPLKDSLESVDKHVQELDKARTMGDVKLNEQIKALADVQTGLQAETQNLANALRNPSVRGMWGEMLLRKVVEIAGMKEHCDFEEQFHIKGEEQNYRPDMIVRMPERRCVVVDSKVPFEAYIAAVNASNDLEKKEGFKLHAKALRSHITQLSGKEYWNKIPDAMPTVVLFLPGEALLSAAVDTDPGLIEFATREKVMLATPTTLIALLSAISYGWSQEKLSVSAAEISEQGKELYDRLEKFAGLFAKLQRSLETTVNCHNEIVGSFERRVLVSARKFKGLAAADRKDIETFEQLPIRPRVMQASEALTPLIDELQEVNCVVVEEVRPGETPSLLPLTGER